MARLEKLVLDAEGEFIGAEPRDVHTYNRRVEVKPVGGVMSVQFPKKDLKLVERDVDGWLGVMQNFVPPQFYNIKERVSDVWGFEVGRSVISGIFRRVVNVPVKFYIIEGFYREDRHFESLLKQ